MKNSIKHFLLPLVCGIAFISCEKQTTPESVQIQRPELQSPIVRDDVYYARLRAYKKTDHKLAFGWFGSWTAINPSEQSRLRSAPDSMDIISIWSQWHSLSREQIEDKAFVQQVLGTKVVFCISAKDVPEEFKVDGQITDESLKDYARAWGKDSIDKYQYDGIDIDFETAADHLGPLNTTPGLFKKFCEELSQYIGPKSGTGRLFLIDGNIDALDQGIAELCNYGVSQAYGCSSATMGYTSLTSRTASAERVGWKADQLIFTENFESYWKSGGRPHTTLSGEQMMSLQGMADFAVNGTSCGFGAYHMEYEYGHSDMPYKYMRQAIQYANPAPHGDYSKNLVTLNEAGEYAFEIPVFPSGMSEGVQFSLTASLTGVPTADADIPLVVDNSLVTAYNNYYYTEYKTLDPALVSFSGPLHFVAGAQDSETPVIVGITDMTALGDEEYLVPVRVDFSKHSGFSANTDKEVCYLKLKTKQQVCVLSLPGMEQVTEISVMQGEDGMVIEKKGYTLQLQASIGVPVDSKFSIVADPALVDSYNKQHGTKYTPMSANDVTLPDELLLPKNSQATTPVEIKAVDYEKLTSDGSMVVLKVDLGGNADFNTIGDKDIVKFVVFKKMEGNIEENATRVPGTVIADMSGWTYDAPGAEGLVSSQMFDGAIAMNQSGWYITNGSVTATVDMVNVHTLAGFLIRPMYGLGYYKVLRLYDVKTSEDGQHWVSQSGDSFVSLALSGDDWQYVKFYKPVSCRFVRMTYRCDKESASNSYVGCNEFNAIASN